jgi:hypothetical protein
LEKLEEIFQWLTTSNSSLVTRYWVKVFYTWHADFLTREKRLMRLLQRWKWTEIEWTKI